MKEVLIMRHAKSDWDNSALDDYDRPLNQRGLKDAPRMGDFLKEINFLPEIIISSPAKRARKTAELVAQSIGYSEKIIFEKAFYFGVRDDYANQLQLLPGHINRVMLVGHNPNMEELVMRFPKTVPTDYTMPTAAMACLMFNVDDWAKIKYGIAELKWKQIPKALPEI